MAVVDLDFSDGLLPAVAQDAGSGEVLMLAYVTPEAVTRTQETGLAHYYSRSREELWQKGATSGHVQRIKEIRVDCDGDALLYLVQQDGGACHTGYESCFYRALDSDTEPGDATDLTTRVETSVIGEQVFDPETVYEQ